MGDEAPLNSLESIGEWVAGVGYKGVQIPTWDARCIDLKKAAESKDYCQEIQGTLKDLGLEITELSTHLQGQLVAVNPAYDVGFDGFAPDNVKNNPEARTAWAVDQMKLAAKASANFGLTAHATFSGALLWHTNDPKRMARMLGAVDGCRPSLADVPLERAAELVDLGTRWCGAVGARQRCCLAHEPQGRAHPAAVALPFVIFREVWHRPRRIIIVGHKPRIELERQPISLKIVRKN
jgi:hypothetical protein